MILITSHDAKSKLNTLIHICLYIYIKLLCILFIILFLIYIYSLYLSLNSVHI